MATALTISENPSHAGGKTTASPTVNPLDINSLNPMGLAMNLEGYLGKPLIAQIGSFGKQETLANRRIRAKKTLPYVSDFIINRIVHMNSYSLKRVSNAVEALKDCLIASSPDMIRSYSTSGAYRKFLRWAYSTAVVDADYMNKQWKAFCKLIKWRAIQSKTDMPSDPSDFPGFGVHKREFPRLWRKLTPWLEPIWYNGVKSKTEATRIMHLCSTRSTPAGGSKTRTEAIEKHSKTLFSHVEISPVRRKIVEKIAFLVGKTSIANGVPRSEAHISLTSSASIDSPVSEGGRAAEFRIKFRAWLLQVSDEDILETTWFGERYWLKAGLPRWQTMCRPEIIHRPDDIFGESSENMTLDFENFKYQDPLHGLDTYTGYQMLQFSIEDAITNGCILGSKYKHGELALGIPSSIRASTIGEPGGKARIVTVGEDFITEILQPFSHHLIGIVKNHPSATKGLTYGWQHFEWCKALSTKEPPYGFECHFLSSDLETATDYCTHELSESMISGFMRAVGLSSNPYFKICTKILCSGRKYEGPHQEYLDMTTRRGILMGEPGAKFVLTLHNLCAETEAFLRFQWEMLEASDEEFYSKLRGAKGQPLAKWRHFVCIGDDHTAQGPEKYLRGITQTHVRNGMKVSSSHNYISTIGSYYSEEMAIFNCTDRSNIWGRQGYFPGFPYETHVHIDAMKLRLFSPCSKECAGKDEPNPAIGKAFSVQGMLSWLAGDFSPSVPIFSARWEERFKSFLPKEDYLKYLPRELGGLHVPAFHVPAVRLQSMIDSIPENHFKLIKKVLIGGGDAQISRILRKFCTDIRSRGIRTDEIEDQIRQTLSNQDLVHGLDDSGLQLLTGKTDQEWVNLRYRDKAHLAKSAGFISVDEAISCLDRPYTFRNLLAPEISAKHGIEVQVSPAYSALPWNTRKRRFSEMIDEKSTTLDSISDPERLEIMSRILSVVHTKGRSIDVQKEVYFLPEAVLLDDTMCTLRTPLKTDA